MINVLLVDDQPLVRGGFAAILRCEPDIVVVGEAGDGGEGYEMAASLKPDVVLMDIRMPNLSGLAATRNITADPNLTQVKVIILTTFEMDEYVFEALRNGACGFLLKSGTPEDLVQAVRVSAAGDAILSPSVTRRLIAEYAQRSKPPHPSRKYHDALTEREREIVTLVGRGLTNDQIAAKLYLSVATVRTHVSRAMTKLDASHRAQLVIFAYETGLVAAGWEADGR